MAFFLFGHIESYESKNGRNSAVTLVLTSRNQRERQRMTTTCLVVNFNGSFEMVHPSY